MGRGRIAAGTGALAAALALAVPALAGAATPIEICTDLADGRVDGTYTAADWAAYQDALQHDPTIQGYCSPIVIVQPPPTTSTATTSTSTTTTGTTTTTPGTSSTTPTTTVATTTPTTTTTGVAGVSTTETGGTPPAGPTVTTTGVAGAEKTKTTPQARPTASPLAGTRTQGTLPFTGAELFVFAIVGAALVAGGALLRASGRQKRTDG